MKPKLIANQLHLNYKISKQSRFSFPSKNQIKFRDAYQFKTHRLFQLVKSNKIVICKADKDGKIIIADYKDYHKIMEAELEQFEILNDWNIDNKNAKFDFFMKQC